MDDDAEDFIELWGQIPTWERHMGEIGDFIEFLEGLEDAESRVASHERLAVRQRLVREFAPDKQYADDLLKCLPDDPIERICEHLNVWEEHDSASTSASGTRANIDWSGPYVDTDVLAGVMQFLLRRYGREGVSGCVLTRKYAGNGDGLGYSIVIERDRFTRYDSEALAEDHLRASNTSQSLVDADAFAAGLDKLIEAQRAGGTEQELAALRALVRAQADLMTPGQRHQLVTGALGSQLVMQAAAEFGEVGLLPELEEQVQGIRSAPGP